MSGTWISQIQADLRRNFPASRDYRPADFRREPMPESVSHFLEHALSRRAAAVQVSADPQWFDVQSADLVEAERQWRRALVDSARYPASLWEASLDQAASLVVSFVLNPAESFCAFAFAGIDGDAPTSIVLNRLSYFRPYSSLREVIRAYIERKNGEPIPREDLRAAILKADRSIVAEFDPPDWVVLLKPLFDLAALSTVANEDAEVPTEMLKQILAAKGADDLVLRLEAIETIGGHRKLTEAALLRAVGPTEPVVRKPEPEPVPATRVDSPPAPAQRNDEHAASPTDGMPRWMQFTQSVRADAAPQSGDGGSQPEPAPIRTPEPAPIRTPEPVQPGPLDETPTEPAALQEVPDSSLATGNSPLRVPMRVGERAILPDDPTEDRVLGRITPLQRDRFVQRLFAGDLAAFRRTMALLESAPDWDAAAHLIGTEVFERHQVDIYSDEAVEFTNAIESRYL